MKVGAGFNVDGDHVGARTGKIGDVVIGVFDHEMNVENRVHLIAQWLEGLHDHRSNRNVRDEVSVHHVHMNPLRACL